MKKIMEWYYGISLKDRFKQRTYDAIMGRNMLTAELMLVIASVIAVFIDANSLKLITASTWILLLVTVAIALLNVTSLYYYRLQVIEADTPEAYRQYVWFAVARGFISTVAGRDYFCNRNGLRSRARYESIAAVLSDKPFLDRGCGSGDLWCGSLCLWVYALARQSGAGKGYRSS